MTLHTFRSKTFDIRAFDYLLSLIKEVVHYGQCSMRVSCLQLKHDRELNWNKSSRVTLNVCISGVCCGLPIENARIAIRRARFKNSKSLGYPRRLQRKIQIEGSNYAQKPL